MEIRKSTSCVFPWDDTSFALCDIGARMLLRLACLQDFVRGLRGMSNTCSDSLFWILALSSMPRTRSQEGHISQQVQELPQNQ